MNTFVKAAVALVILTALAVAPPAHSSGDIAYSARYYYPYGDHRTSHFHIYRIDPDGAHRVRLTHDNYEDYEPAWSPDGRWIAYLREWWNDDTGKGGSRIVVMRPDGSDDHEVSASDYPIFAWSADSKSITGITESDQNDKSTYTTYTLSGRELSSKRDYYVDPLILLPYRLTILMS